MKITLFILSAIFSSFISSVPSVTERLGVHGPLTFNEKQFFLAWSDHPKDTYYVQEYLPEGETAEKFTRMLTLHLFVTDIKVNEAVQQKTKELDKRKKTDAVCNYIVTESPDKKEFIVDFLLGESKGESMALVEFNVYRYRAVDLGNHKKGILVYAFSKRSYGDDITEFFKTLKDDRIAALNTMIASRLPDVSLEGN